MNVLGRGLGWGWGLGWPRVLALCLVASPTLASGQAVEQQSQDRAKLEALVIRGFIDRVAETLELSGDERTELLDIAQRTQVRRSALAREAGVLRRRLGAALQRDDTPPAAFERLLDRVMELRREELALWEEEQAAVARLLSPRERAEYMAAQARLNAQVQRMRRNQQPPGDGSD